MHNAGGISRRLLVVTLNHSLLNHVCICYGRPFMEMFSEEYSEK